MVLLVNGCTIGSIGSTLFLFYTSVLFSPHWSFSVYLVHFGPFYPLQSYLVNIGPIQSTMVLFGSLCPIRFYLFLFSPYVHFGPNMSIHSYLVHVDPSLSTLFPFVHSIHFIPFSPFVSTSIYFGPLWFIFMNLNIRKRYVWIESTYSKYKFIKNNIDLKLAISKILSITFIVDTLLLSHINVAFQSTSVRLNSREILSKP